jgi:aspartate/methionine/tyrosine aminotransferase
MPRGLQASGGAGSVAAVRISPTLTDLGTYPFVHLEQARRRLLAEGRAVLDFGKGDPQEPTDPRIRQALVDSLGEHSNYPLAEGLPELRRAAAGWVRRRFGVELDPEREIVPTYGSKEAIFSLAQVLVDGASDKRLVVTTEPGYPVPERGAVFAGADTLALPLRAGDGFLPDLDALDEAAWRRVALLWVNYPNNPTGAVAPLAVYERR